MNRDQIISLLTNAQAKKYIEQAESLFKTVPHLPKAITDILVTVVPWLVGISGIFSAINGIQYIMYSFGVRQLAVISGISPGYWLILGVQQLVVAYLSLLAFQLLREKKYVGWVLLFWIMASSVVASIATIVFIPGALLPSLLGVLIGAYLTFEIKNDFTEGGTLTTPSSVKTSKPKAKK